MPGDSDGAWPWENVLPALPDAVWYQTSALSRHYSQGRRASLLCLLLPLLDLVCVVCFWIFSNVNILHTFCAITSIALVRKRYRDQGWEAGTSAHWTLQVLRATCMKADSICICRKRLPYVNNNLVPTLLQFRITSCKIANCCSNTPSCVRIKQRKYVLIEF